MRTLAEDARVELAAVLPATLFESAWHAACRILLQGPAAPLPACFACAGKAWLRVRPEGVEPSAPGPSSRSVFQLRHGRVAPAAGGLRALGEIRTHTVGALNAVPLPLGYEGVRGDGPDRTGAGVNPTSA